MKKKRKEFERLLCLDLSMNSTGFVVIDVNRRTSEFLIQNIGTTNTTKVDEWGEKYEIIYKQMVYFRDVIKPDNLIIERPYMQHGVSTMAIMGALGIVRYAFKGCGEPTFISANTIKKVIAGHGHAKKYLVKSALLRMFPDINFANDDESDALGLAITYLKQEGIL